MRGRLARHGMSLLGALTVLFWLSPDAFAGNERSRNSVLLFGGPMMQGHFPGDAIIPFGSRFDRRMILGAALQHDFVRFENGVSFGTEAGVAARVGPDVSGEVWGGVSATHVGPTIGPITISPSLVVGLSAVNKAVGIESRRRGAKGDARLLFYLGPELQFRSSALPGVALVYRIHHRSGAWHTLGNMRDATNSNVIGLKIDF
ncbi:hypothetical protein EJC49_05930 [Aquibium carbonis]|uniref:Acyloxyacyl hydrolase n=1 Tax=Aquibium carbonis TaxID=2495581 RepID=A0A3S0AAK6_9HYPH|nr:hypothetical protein [Aquibium carbonis]RST87341.1 hypothetical protein EJC49_05930 [Aquibium carbonis]